MPRARASALIILTAITAAVSAAAGAVPIAKGPYLQNPHTDSITVCWITTDDQAGTVRYKEAGAAPSDRRSYSVAETVKSLVHRVRLTGLRPHTRYAYSALCAGETLEDSFRTAATLTQPFRFAAYGDCRTQPAQHAAVLARMAQFHPEFILQTGDLVQDGTNEAQWDEFFNVVGKTLRDTPYYPALGNHEKSGAPYFRYFEVEREYSFDYGNAHFTVLDSNRPAAEFAAQDEFLRRDLAAHQSATWRIVSFHHTPYTCVDIEKRREDAVKLRARLEPLFQQGKVQLVINGHDHDYQHHLANGIHYVVTGGGGAPLYNVRLDTPFTKAAKKAHHHCEITVDGNEIGIRAVEPDGTVIEQFGLRAG